MAEPIDDRERRRVLAALVSMAPILGCVRPTTTGPPQAPPALRGSIPDSVLEAGRLYLAAYPEEAGEQRLRAAVGLREGESDAAWIERLGQAIRAQIDAGELIELTGWQLAPTEGRLYALASLVGSTSAPG